MYRFMLWLSEPVRRWIAVNQGTACAFCKRDLWGCDPDSIVHLAHGDARNHDERRAHAICMQFAHS